jgi:hypothetical protein
MSLIHFGGVDSFILRFFPSAADVDPLARTITDAAAAGTLLALEGGAAFDLATSQDYGVLPPGQWFLSAVGVAIGAVTTEECRINVVRNMTDRTDPTSGTDVIDNAVTNGAAFVDYIQLAVAAATNIYYDAPQNPGFVDNSATPVMISSGFVEAQRTFADGDSVGVSIASAGATGDIAAPVQVSLVFCRTRGDS